jgi:predicted glycosyltransferase
MLFELFVRWIKVFRIIRKEKIEVAISSSGISTSLPARLCGVRNVIFTDNEDAFVSNHIAFPFGDVIITPKFYRQNLGKKHRKIHTLKELTYLNATEESHFQKERSLLGLPEKYSLVRLVSYDAAHDWGHEGIQNSDLEKLFHHLSLFGKVFFSSQRKMPNRFESLRLKIPVDSIHAVISGAQIFVGESPTMAVEASLLSVPSFLVTSRAASLGNMKELEEKYHLLKNYKSMTELLKSLPSREELTQLKKDWVYRSNLLKHEMTDLTDVFLDEILGETLKGKTNVSLTRFSSTS